MTVVLDGLAFANGVALAADESFVCVAETRGRTVVRLWLTGPRAGDRDLLAGDLPGYPDNISRGSDGLVWVSIASPVDAVGRAARVGADGCCARRSPGSRRRCSPGRSGRSGCRPSTCDGRLVHDLAIDHPGYHMVTGVREHEGRVWMGSLHEPSVAVYDLA